MSDKPFSPFRRGGLSLWRFNYATGGTRVYFSTRHGGVSRIPYASLNLGFHVEDLPERVQENRKLLAAIFDLDPGRFTSPVQRHTAEACWVDDETLVGTGSAPLSSFEAPNPLDPCDALLTTMSHSPLLLHFADCVPVVVTAKASGKPVISVIHAGREGLLKGIITSAMEKFPPETVPASIRAAVGPCIGPCCYEVDEKTAGMFRERFGEEAEDQGYLDLRHAARQELIKGGVEEDNIHALDICTSCDDHFFSYRREGVTGRHAAIAWIGDDSGKPHLKKSRAQRREKRS